MGCKLILNIIKLKIKFGGGSYGKEGRGHA